MSDRVSIPPSPICDMISVSCQSSISATFRTESRSRRLPWNSVCLVDRRTGRQADVSEQSQTMSRAHGCIWSCPSTRVGIALGRLPPLISATAASTRANQVRTWLAYTPSRNSASMGMSPSGGLGRVAAGWSGVASSALESESGSVGAAACGAPLPSEAGSCKGLPSGARVWWRPARASRALPGNRRRLHAFDSPSGLSDRMGLDRSPGNDSDRRAAAGSASLWRSDAKLTGSCLAASHASAISLHSMGPSVIRPSPGCGSAGWGIGCLGSALHSKFTWQVTWQVTADTQVSFYLPSKWFTCQVNDLLGK